MIVDKIFVLICIMLYIYQMKFKILLWIDESDVKQIDKLTIPGGRTHWINQAIKEKLKREKKK